MTNKLLANKGKRGKRNIANFINRNYNKNHNFIIEILMNS